MMPLAADRPSPVADSKAPVVFKRITPGPRLFIPAGPLDRAHELAALPIGTTVARGERLALSWPAEAAAPLAPCPAVVRGVVPGDAGLGSPLSMIALEALAPRADRGGDSSGAPGAEDHRAPSLPGPDADPIDPFPASAADLGAMLDREKELTLEGLLARLREAGVWADRWSTPDLLGQLRGGLVKPIDSVICDLLDEAPEVLLHDRLALVYPVELSAGILALSRAARAKTVTAVLAAFADSGSWDALRRASAGTELKLQPLADHYPQSHPALLIHELTGRHCRPRRLPSDLGVLVVGAATAIAIGRCLLHSAPMLEAPVAVRDRLAGQTHWLSVPIGMTWGNVLGGIGIPPSQVELRGGNPIREARLSMDSVVSGGETAVTAVPRARARNPDPCIRCAWCVEGCPVHISPVALLEAAQQDDPYLADQYSLDACIECGICTYVCPSNLEILSGIRTLRAPPIRRRDRA